TGYQAAALQLAADRAGLSVPDDLESVAIGDIPAGSELFGPTCVYGAADVFSRLAGVLVDPASDRTARPGPDQPSDSRFFPRASLPPAPVPAAAAAPRVSAATTTAAPSAPPGGGRGLRIAHPWPRISSASAPSDSAIGGAISLATPMPSAAFIAMTSPWVAS